MKKIYQKFYEEILRLIFFEYKKLNIIIPV